MPSNPRTTVLVNELYESDAASALTNRAARRIEQLEAAIRTALDFHQVTHIHAALRDAVKDAE